MRKEVPAAAVRATRKESSDTAVRKGKGGQGRPRFLSVLCRTLLRWRQSVDEISGLLHDKQKFGEIAGCEAVRALVFAVLRVRPTDADAVEGARCAFGFARVCEYAGGHAIKTERLDGLRGCLRGSGCFHAWCVHKEEGKIPPLAELFAQKKYLNERSKHAPMMAASKRQLGMKLGFVRPKNCGRS